MHITLRVRVINIPCNIYRLLGLAPWTNLKANGRVLYARQFQLRIALITQALHTLLKYGLCILCKKNVVSNIYVYSIKLIFLNLS